MVGSVLFVLLLSPALSLAQPTVERISYNDSQGGIVVHGSSFGPGPEVVIFENFEQGSAYSDHFSSISGGWYEDVIILQEADGNHAYQLRDQAAFDAGQKGFTQMKVDLGQSYSRGYVSLSAKVPDGTTFPAAATEETFPDPSSWKFTWLYSGSDGYGGDDRFDICLPTHIGQGQNVLGGNEGTLVYLSGFEDWWEWDHYNHMATFIGFDPESPHSRPADYMWTVINNIVNHVQVEQAPVENLHTDNYSFDRISIPGWWGNGNLDDFDAVYDNIYAAVGPHARARLVISDHPDYRSSTFAATIMPTEWASDRIEFSSSLVPEDRPYYLHVFDTDNVRSDEGVRVCPTCPTFRDRFEVMSSIVSSGGNRNE